MFKAKLTYFDKKQNKKGVWKDKETSLLYMLALVNKEIKETKNKGELNDLYMDRELLINQILEDEKISPSIKMKIKRMM